jgi:hypothetical protein
MIVCKAVAKRRLCLLNAEVLIAGLILAIVLPSTSCNGSNPSAMLLLYDSHHVRRKEVTKQECNTKLLMDHSYV